MLTASAPADSFTDPNSTPPPPAYLYSNFKRVAPPDSVSSLAIEDFIANRSGNALSPTQTQTVLFEDPSDQYSKSLVDAIFKNFTAIHPENYKVGQPDSLNP